MARLLVLRGETLDRAVELIRLPLRIGRGQQNDLVLEDPVKSVSRDHAEIRLEDGRYVLVDLESQNGIWVAGNRVPNVALEPNVIASIGRFRLMVEDVGTVSDISPSQATAAASDPKARPADPVGRPKTPPLRPARVSTPARAANQMSAQQRNWIVGGVSIAGAVLALTIGVMLFRSAPPPEDPQSEMRQRMAAAVLQIDRGACAEALAEHIEPALARDPSNAEVLNVKRRAESCVAPPTPPNDPSVDAAAAIAATVASAPGLIEQGDCRTALGRLDNVLNTEPDNADARALKAQAEECLARATPTALSGPKPVLAVRLPPESGGIEPLPGELDRDYQVRVKLMRSRYDEAVSAASRGASRIVIASFEGIARDATTRYLDIDEKLAEARRAWKATAQPVLVAARDLAVKGMWVEALKMYEQARDIDPTVPVSVEVGNVELAKLTAGQDACKRGKQTISYNNSQGMEFFRRALALLPSDDPCYQDAKKYVDGVAR